MNKTSENRLPAAEGGRIPLQNKIDNLKTLNLNTEIMFIECWIRNKILAFDLS